jgi:hypothetical protein
VTPRNAGHERVYRGLLRLYPKAFRARFSDEMVQLFSDQLRDARTAGAPAGAARTWLRTLGDLAVTVASEHMRRNRTVAHSLTVSPSNSSRLLGLGGILGGALLLAAFLPFYSFEPPINQLRLILFCAGAMAIIVGVHRRQSSISPALALVAAVPAFLANGWYLVMVALAIGRDSPFSGDFGFVWFVAGMSMWLTDGWFGIVTLRLGAVSRLGALALAVGSLAVVGLDRLGLVSASGTNPTIFGSLALAGIAMNGLGWILVGLDVATRRRAPVAQRQEVRPEG